MPCHPHFFFFSDLCACFCNKPGSSAPGVLLRGMVHCLSLFTLLSPHWKACAFVCVFVLIVDFFCSALTCFLLAMFATSDCTNHGYLTPSAVARHTPPVGSDQLHQRAGQPPPNGRPRAPNTMLGLRHQALCFATAPKAHKRFKSDFCRHMSSFRSIVSFLLRHFC